MREVPQQAQKTRVFREQVVEVVTVRSAVPKDEVTVLNDASLYARRSRWDRRTR